MQRSAVTGQVELTQQSVYRIVDALTERGMVVQGGAGTRAWPRTAQPDPAPQRRLCLFLRYFAQRR
ncbi:hypothetical protein QW131_21675 [Roseibium salinum]|nr:hypothetical protein [Roseibium salinum]